MRYDNIIIGGGLSGLVSGIALARGGSKVAIISSGKSALHFFSGSLELLNGGVEAMARLCEENPSHPYAKIGVERAERYTTIVKDIFARAGISLQGGVESNHLRLTPLGALKPAWLTMEHHITFNAEGECGYRKVAIVGIDGYLDFYPEFIARSLEQRGVECNIYSVNLAELNRLRESATEMRAVNISRYLCGEVLGELARKVAEKLSDEELVLLPDVLGLGDEQAVERLEKMVGRRVMVAPTVSASVAGVRVQRALTEEFRRLGGEFVGGDSVTSCRVEDGRVRALFTANHEDEEFVAENYIIATGSFFSRGLVATPEGVCEPVVGVDVEAPARREEWYGNNLLGAQPFERFGVVTDQNLRPLIGGKPVENLYAVGAVLAGADAVREGSGGGIAVMSALRVVEEIEKRG